MTQPSDMASTPSNSSNLPTQLQKLLSLLEEHRESKREKTQALSTAGPVRLQDHDTPLPTHINEDTPIMSVLLGHEGPYKSSDAEILANDTCAAIQNRKDQFPEMQLYGRLGGMRMTFEPAARDLTSIWYKVHAICSRGKDATRTAKRISLPGLMCNSLLRRLVKWNLEAFPESREWWFARKPDRHTNQFYESTLTKFKFHLDLKQNDPYTSMLEVLESTRLRAIRVVEEQNHQVSFE